MRILKFAALISVLAFSAQAQEGTSLAEQFPIPEDAEPQEVLRESYGTWEIRCVGETDNCFMYQLLINERGTPVAELSLIKLPAGSEAVAGATMIVPLGTVLTKGLVIQVDENEATRYPFNWCVAPGCFSRFGLPDLLVNNMKTGTDLKVVVFSVSNLNEPVVVSASLEGFTAAFDALPHQTNN